MRKFLATLLAPILLATACANPNQAKIDELLKHKEEIEHLVQLKPQIEDLLDPPPSRDYQIAEEVVASIDNPITAKTYVIYKIPPVKDRWLGGSVDIWRSLEQSLKYGFGDCDDITIAVAAMLSDDGYPPLMLYVREIPDKSEKNPEKRELFCHTVFLFQDKHKKYGSVGSLLTDSQVVAKHDTIEDLIYSWRIPNMKHFQYKVLNLDDIKGFDYIHGQGNLWWKILDDDHWEKVPWQSNE